MEKRFEKALILVEEIERELKIINNVEYDRFYDDVDQICELVLENIRRLQYSVESVLEEIEVKNIIKNDNNNNNN